MSDNRENYSNKQIGQEEGINQKKIKEEKQHLPKIQGEIKQRTGVQWRKWICLAIGICFGAVLTGVVISQRSMAVDARISEVQGELSKEVFRFHVLADSDSDDAQRVKRKVRDRVLEYMRSDMPGSKELVSVNATKEWAQEHLFQIEQIAEEVVREEGFSYGARAEVETCYFPVKQYGDVTFPEGWYEALQIKLGSARGHNWWCVLYPNLCFTDVTCSVVSEDGKEELRRALTEEEYELVTATSDFKIKSFFFSKK